MHIFNIAQKKISLLVWHAIGIIGLNSDDIIITSFPKSGNTWIRFFFCNVISLKEWGGEEVSFPVLDKTMPELGVSNLLRSWNFDSIPRVVKTHKSRWPIFYKNKSVLLIRDPRDVMVSYYHYENNRREGYYNGNFSEFIRSNKFGVSAWCYHYKSWLSDADIVVKYEDLKEDDIVEFERIINALNLDIASSVIEVAARRSRFEKVKEVEKREGIRESKSHFEDGGEFMRDGSTKQWEGYFSKEDLLYTKRVLEENNIEAYSVKIN